MCPSYTPADRRWCLYTAASVESMGVHGSTLSLRPWLTVSSERSRLSLDRRVSCMCPGSYANGGAVR